jgi:hypothetical protein
LNLKTLKIAEQSLPFTRLSTLFLLFCIGRAVVHPAGRGPALM